MGDLVLGVDLGFTRNNPMAIVLLEQGVDVSKLWEHYTYEPDISVEWQTRLVDIGRWLDDYISAQNTNKRDKCSLYLLIDHNTLSC